jgi:hypothetical protein
MMTMLLFNLHLVTDRCPFEMYHLVEIFLVIFGTVIFWHITWVIFWHITWTIDTQYNNDINVVLSYYKFLIFIVFDINEDINICFLKKRRRIHIHYSSDVSWITTWSSFEKIYKWKFIIIHFKFILAFIILL